MVNKLEIVRIGNLFAQRVDLQIGSNIIGRGAATGRVDNPIAAVKAVRINVAPNGAMTMTPMLPCDIKTGCSDRWRSLKVGRAISVRTGDVCSILPYRSWFKIISDDSDTMEEDNGVNGKRKSTNPLEEEPPKKRVRSEESIETAGYTETSDSDVEGVILEEDDTRASSGAEINDVSGDSSACKNSESAPNGSPSVEVISMDNENATQGNITGTASTVTEATERNPDDSRIDRPESEAATSRNRDEAGKKIKWDCGRHFSDQTDQKNNDTTQEADGASGSTEKSPEAVVGTGSELDDLPRNRCTYGSQCYRRNSEHRVQFSHPGDADYDAPDDRPECPYGIRCYRKNPQHRRDFKHTKNRRNRAQTPVRAVTPNATSGTEQSSAEESVDESDYEPSLATSDDYESEYDKSDYDGISDLNSSGDK